MTVAMSINSTYFFSIYISLRDLVVSHPPQRIRFGGFAPTLCAM